jgi:hypothetical protein
VHTWNFQHYHSHNLFGSPSDSEDSEAGYDSDAVGDWMAMFDEHQFHSSADEEECHRQYTTEEQGQEEEREKKTDDDDDEQADAHEEELPEFLPAMPAVPAVAPLPELEPPADMELDE